MSHITVNDDLYKDLRFLRFVCEEGSLEECIGAYVRAMTVAVPYWEGSKLPIPALVWKQQMLHDGLIEHGLAIKLENGDVQVEDVEYQI